MGLLDGLVSGIGGGPGARRPGLGNTIAAGAILALLVKGVRSYQASHSGAAHQPSGGGLGGLLGGIGGGGLGGLLGGLGGAGALGALVNRFQQQGHAEQASSWVEHGDNQSIAPQEVGRVLGEDTLKELQERSGLTREQLLQQLAEELPDAINAATPEGRLPTDDELQQIARPS